MTTIGNFNANFQKCGLKEAKSTTSQFRLYQLPNESLNLTVLCVMTRLL